MLMTRFFPFEVINPLLGHGSCALMAFNPVLSCFKLFGSTIPFDDVRRQQVTDTLNSLIQAEYIKTSRVNTVVAQ